MLSDFYNLVLEEDLRTRHQVYSYLADLIRLPSLECQEVLNRLYNREQIGSILIADSVVLPHLEHEGSEQGIIMVRPREAIRQWSDTVGRVELILFLVVAEQGMRKEKEVIRDFVKKSASDRWLNFLKSEKDRRLILKAMTDKSWTDSQISDVEGTDGY